MALVRICLENVCRHRLCTAAGACTLCCYLYFCVYFSKRQNLWLSSQL